MKSTSIVLLLCVAVGAPLINGCSSTAADNGTDGGSTANSSTTGGAGTTTSGTSGASGAAGATGGSGSTVVGGGSDGGAVSTSPHTCPGILECVSNCADGDTACVDACVGQGSPDAQAALNNIVTCVQNNGCTDAACYQSKCATEFQACVESAHSGGQPLQGAAPAGSIPPELVGRWSGLEDSYEFNADGTCFNTSDIKGVCETKSLENCNAVAAGTTLTLYFTSGTFTICGTPSTDPYMPTTRVYTYRFNADGTALYLDQQNCTGSFCSSGYDKF